MAIRRRILKLGPPYWHCFHVSSSFGRKGVDDDALLAIKLLQEPVATDNDHEAF
jgi:hypothetical protein